jgi:predicted transcriptional regulator
MKVEHVFYALADHNRRHLLDLLSEADGHALTKPSAHLPLSRYGAMKHLCILEESSLDRLEDYLLDLQQVNQAEQEQKEHNNDPDKL